MGEVYRARDEKLGREVALKFLPAELALNPDALRRFEQEARAASALNHPNIVTIYEVSRTEDVAWIAMELIDGESLRELIAREPLPLKNVLRIAVKIAEGLAAAHDRNIAHRDLKPDNVMISREGFVKILDFGLAKQMRRVSQNDTTMPHTMPGTVFGTASYMSPEQARGKEMDYRSDQFSFAVMLYEMLTRSRPFDRESKPETMTAIIRDDVPPPTEILALNRIVTRCLAKQPRDRYGSTRDLAHDLREVRDALTFPSQRSQPPVLLTKKRLPWLAGVAALVGIGLIVAGVMMWKNRASTKTARIDTVAVMPFRDLTGTAEGRMLADGISEMIASRLGEVRELRVAAPFDGAPVPANADDRDAAQRKRVQALVRGSVQRGGDEVRVTYSLVHPAGGGTLLSNIATRPASDLFALEDSITSDLLSSLGHAPRPRPQTAPAAILGPNDQRRFVEAVGLLTRVKDEGSIDRAINTLESLLTNARESGPVNALLARALLYKSKLARRPALIEQATVYAARAASFSADDADAHITLGDLRNASGQHADALQSFDRALTLRPNDASALTGRADALRGLGRAADAEAAYQKAIRVHPESVGAHMRYGEFCYLRGRHADAATQFRLATEISPELSIAWSNLGATLQALNRNAEALGALQRSIALKPSAPGFENLGNLQFSLSQYDEAVKSYERATQIAPADFVAWSNLGDARKWSKTSRDRAGDAYARAVTVARSTLSVNPNDAYTRAAMAACLAQNGELDEAQKEIRRALEIDPTNAMVLYKAALVAVLRGNTDSAISWIEQAVKSGYPVSQIVKDPEFTSLRQLPSFRSAVESKG